MRFVTKFVDDYLARHRNGWNRALHLVGVPLAPILVVVLLVTGRFWLASACFALGYTLQWIGHRIEGNSMWDSFEGQVVRALTAPVRLVRSRS